MAKFNHDEIRDTLRVHERTQNISATARELGVKRETVRNRLRYAKEQGIATPEQQIATLHGVNPEFDLTHAVPAPLILKGTSTLTPEMLGAA